MPWRRTVWPSKILGTETHVAFVESYKGEKTIFRDYVQGFSLLDKAKLATFLNRVTRVRLPYRTGSFFSQVNPLKKKLAFMISLPCTFRHFSLCCPGQQHAAPIAWLRSSVASARKIIPVKLDNKAVSFLVLRSLAMVNIACMFLSSLVR